MSKVKYMAVMALKEHLLTGNRVSLIEAILLFGVQNLNAELTRIRQDGFIVKSDKVPMAKIVRRLNDFTIYESPKNLPIREILMTEYWISR